MITLSQHLTLALPAHRVPEDARYLRRELVRGETDLGPCSVGLVGTSLVINFEGADKSRWEITLDSLIRSIATAIKEAS